NWKENATISEAWDKRCRRRHRSEFQSEIEVHLHTEEKENRKSSIGRERGMSIKNTSRTRDTWSHIRHDKPRSTGDHESGSVMSQPLVRFATTHSKAETTYFSVKILCRDMETAHKEVALNQLLN
ncbi:LOW QUALITY PROTEIN: hypothetical protein HID58_056160, partial [Brassica napus]